MMRRVPAALAALAAVAIAASTLATKVHEVIERPLSGFQPGMQHVPVEIPSAPHLTLHGTVHVHRVKLRFRDPTDLPSHQVIRLLVTTYLSSPTLESAELRVVGTGCVFRTAPGAAFENNTTLSFVRGGACVPLRGSPTGEVDLIIRFSTPGRAALWTWAQPLEMDAGVAGIIADPAIPASPARPALRGEYVDSFGRSAYRRLDLLSHMWQLGGPAPLVNLFALGALLLVAGAVAMPTGDVVRRPASISGGAVALMATGLTIMYAIVVPPFQAPDEPSHFLGVLYAHDGVRRDDAVQAWAKIGHFERLRFDGNERFRPVDLRHAETEDWRDVPPTWFSERGGLLVLWKTVTNMTEGAPLPHVFLALRLAHGVLFGVLSGLAAAAVVRGTGVPGAWRALAPVWFIPMLPFFAMHVSNHALLIGPYVLAAAAAVVLFLNGARANWGGFLLGAAAALAVVTSRSALPMAPLIAAIASCRFVKAPERSAMGRKHAMLFWAGLALSIAGLAGLPAHTFPGAMRGFEARLLLALGLAGALAVACVTEMRIPAAPAGSSRAAQSVCAVLILGIVIPAVVSLVVPLPSLRTVDLAARPGAIEYLREAVASALTWPRLRDHDFLLSTSFWGSFGWLDRRFPPLAISAIVSIVAGAATHLLWTLGRRADWPRLLRLAVLTTGALASFCVYAVATVKASPDLHGRYLVGLYLVVLTIIWSGFALRKTSAWDQLHVAVPLLVHGATFWFILTRYF